MEQHIQEMVATNPMIGQLNTQFTSWLLGSGLTGKEIIEKVELTFNNKETISDKLSSIRDSLLVTDSNKFSIALREILAK